MRSGLWIFFFCSSLAQAAKEPTNSKDFTLSLPLISLGHDGGVWRSELNLGKQALALEWQEWLGAQAREELTSQEKEDWINQSLTSTGKEIGVMWERFTQPQTMAGGYYGLGVGIRQIKTQWAASSSEVQNRLMEGALISGRLGYRYVGDMGLLFGTYASLKQFRARLRKDPQAAPLTAQEESLYERFRNPHLLLGVEAGFAI